MNLYVTRLVVAAAAVLVAAGCGPAERPVTGRFQHVAADRIAVEVFKADKLSQLGEQLQRRRVECMADRGYPQLAEAAAGGEGGSDLSSTLNATAPDFAVRSEVEARRSGFGQDEPRQAPHVLSYDKGFDETLERCTDEAAKRLGGDLPRVRADAYDLMNVVSVEVAGRIRTGSAASTFKALAAPLLDCLDRAGFRPAKSGVERDIDAYGLGVATGHLAGADPAPPRRVRGTVETLPAAPARAYVPTPAEAALAVAAARCARETGYAAKFVTARLDVTRQVIAAHEEPLVRLGERIEKLAARLP